MSESLIFPAYEGDPEMDQAFKKARETFRFFWREMTWERRRIIPGLSMAAVKAAFSDPPEVQAENPDAVKVEHMWITDVDFDGRAIYGTLLNAPNWLQTYSEGDPVKFGGKQLSDWLYVCGDEVCGGFTIDLLRSRMSPSERKEHDGAWGLNFGPVGIVNVVPPSFTGDGPAKKKGGLLSMFSKTPPPEPQNYAALATTEHPMSIHMRDSMIESLKEDPSLMDEVDDYGMTFLHQFALAGALDAVDVCLQYGADPKRPAKNGMTPLALAKCLGWTKVMQRIQQAGGV